MKHLGVVFVFFSVFLFHDAANAYSTSTMRCGNDLATVGDSYFKVINICGKPCYEEDMAEGDNNKFSGRKTSYYCIDGYTYSLMFYGSNLKQIDSTQDKCQPCK